MSKDPRTMPGPAADLSSATTALEELATRFAQLAGEYASAAQDHAAAELYAVEASMTSAARRMRRVLRSEA
ncbi:MAG: hypothetical protein ACRDYD_10510 [Acidimicrobiales bacterium]